MATGTISFDALAPEGFALKDFQTVGVAYAAVNRRVLIADEMGLGKTIQALMTIIALGLKGVVVVCPASLKGNWANEVRKWLPGYTVAIAGGKVPYHVDADIVIVNYDILTAWAPFLAQPNVLVLDESHYAKNPGAQRTKAARELAASVPDEGAVLLLTGTPVQNRPIELIAQLQILGRLEDVAPRPHKGRGPGGEITERDWEFAFKFQFCGPEHNGHGYEFKGSSNLPELNRRLRRACMVRRERSEVLGLNDTKRVKIPLSLNGALDKYRAAEAEIIEFVAEEKALQAKLAAKNDGATDAEAEEVSSLAAIKARLAVLRAETLVKLGTLRKLAGEAKVNATVEWVENFLDSNPDKSLVIFAWHKPVQARLVKALAKHEPAQILGGQRDVEAQKARFQNKETRLIICSIKAASEGHTLVAASDVLFVEQPWHAGAEQQAEDRCNRMGQEAEQVFAWKLLAAGTVDEDVDALIEQKRSVYRGAVIGEDASTDDESAIETALLDGFRRRVDNESREAA